jgi:hypothetical protein
VICQSDGDQPLAGSRINALSRSVTPVLVHWTPRELRFARRLGLVLMFGALAARSC